PIISRTIPTRITNRLRFRPATPREIIPTAAPMIASGMISQLAQPRKGMKATTAKISATKPMINEARSNMQALVASFRSLRQPRGAQQGGDVKHERDPDCGEGDRVGDRQRLTIRDGNQELHGRRDELEH